jgi:hypothetical protein
MGKIFCDQCGDSVGDQRVICAVCIEHNDRAYTALAENLEALQRDYDRLIREFNTVGEEQIALLAACEYRETYPSGPAMLRDAAGLLEKEGWLGSADSLRKKAQHEEAAIAKARGGQETP